MVAVQNAELLMIQQCVVVSHAEYPALVHVELDVQDLVEHTVPSQQPLVQVVYPNAVQSLSLVHDTEPLQLVVYTQQPLLLHDLVLPDTVGQSDAVVHVVQLDVYLQHPPVQLLVFPDWSSQSDALEHAPYVHTSPQQPPEQLP